MFASIKNWAVGKQSLSNQPIESTIMKREFKLNDYAQHKLTKKVGRVIGVTNIGGQRKLSVEWPNGKQALDLAEREFCLASSSEYTHYASILRNQ